MTRRYAGLRVDTKKEPCGSLCSLKIVKRVLQVDVEVVDVISEVLKQALVVLSLVLRHQRFKSGSDLQGAVEAFLLSHWMVVEVRGISPETIMACQAGSVNPFLRQQQSPCRQQAPADDAECSCTDASPL